MKEIRNIIYVNTVYTLLLSLIKNPKIEENLYFFNEDFYPDIMDNIENKIILKKYKNIKFKLIREVMVHFFLKKLKKYYSKELDGISFYLQDFLTYSQYFFNNFNCNFYLLEDGVGNYFLEKRQEKKGIYKKYIRMEKINYPVLGISDKISKIFLTGILPIPKIIENKVELLNINMLWQELSSNEKDKIFKVFNLNFEELKKMLDEKDKILLITQPLSEDKFVTEKEKIEIYSKILKERGIKKIYIKPHPRERTNYSNLLKEFEVEIISKNFPAEFFMLVDSNFKKVITIFSTAAYNLKNRYDVEIIGIEKYPKLYIK